MTTKTNSKTWLKIFISNSTNSKLMAIMANHKNQMLAYNKILF